MFKLHQRVINRIIARPTVLCLVATMKEDPEVAFGFLVSERESQHVPAVHFLYVKEHFRNMGISKLLMQTLDWDLNRCFYTHHAGDINLFLGKFPEMKFYPYLA